MEKINKIAAIAFLWLGSIWTLAMFGASQAANIQTIPNQVSTVSASTVKDQSEIWENNKETNDDKINETGDQKDESEKDAALPTNAITKELAMKNALAGKVGVTITETKIWDENGIIVYEFEMSDNTDVKIDAVKWTVVQDQEDKDENWTEPNDDK